jgi:aromatic-L-amino-acid decarboxylase
MSPQEFQLAAEQVMQRIAAFLRDPEQWRVLPAVVPGAVKAGLPAAPPEQGEPFEQVLRDFDHLIMPATTHWNHPGFMAYFATTGSAAGILAEALIAMLNVNAMLWRSGPAATELEEVTLGWLRQMIGLPAAFEGVINDTASSSTLYALAAARESLSDLRIREDGLSGRPEVPRLLVYCSEEAHSSVDKAVITLGLGLSAVRHIPTDDQFRMDVAALRAAIAEDKRNGLRPMAVVATVGTTSTTAIDPVPAIADICAREGIWLHVDAAYARTHGLFRAIHHQAGHSAGSVQPGSRIPDHFRGGRRAQSDGLRCRARPSLSRTQAVVRTALLRYGRHRGTVAPAHGHCRGARALDPR